MRKFGIEIEAGMKPGMTRQALSVALANAGLGGTPHGYMGFHPTQWVVKTDGSVPNGCEVVGPPLDFDDEAQRDQLTRVVKIMQDFCRPVPQAGIHVHVESRDLNARQIGAVARGFAHFEDVLYRLASSGWQSIRPEARRFAKPLTAAQKTGLALAKTDEAIKRAYYGPDYAFVTNSNHGHHSRYFALNLHSHFYRGTIEFRLFNSSLNAMRIQTYLAICMALVQDARNGHLRSVNKATKLGDMATGRVDAAKVFFRFQQIVRYYGDMNLDDFKNLKRLWKDSKAQHHF